jgi:hypothetical protein
MFFHLRCVVSPRWVSSLFCPAANTLLHNPDNGDNAGLLPENRKKKIDANTQSNIDLPVIAIVLKLYYKKGKIQSGETPHPYDATLPYKENRG